MLRVRRRTATESRTSGSHCALTSQLLVALALVVDRRPAVAADRASARSWPARIAASSIPTPEPRLFSFNSPLGACPECEGFGNVIGIDMELVVPDPSKSLREGAIAPWNTPAYAHELEELLALAGDYDLPVDVPFRELDRAAA